MAYCTSDDVANYATLNVSTDVDTVLTAIEIAQTLINTYTNDLFETTEQTVIVSTNNAGIATLPYTTQTISVVNAIEYELEIPQSGFIFTPGRNASVQITSKLPWNILVVGREPWASRPIHRNQTLQITGVFGHESTPAGVKEATAMLAALLLNDTGKATLTDAGSTVQGADPNIQSMSVEGFSVSYKAQTEASTTGSTVIDRLLTPFVRKSRSRWS